MNALRALIVAGDPLVRAGLAALLASRPEIVVAGQVDGESDLAEMVAIYQPDVILWDVGWEPTLGLLGSPLASGDPTSSLEELDLATVALLPDEEHTTDAWIAGARGILLREVGSEVLVSALLAVVQGLVVLDPELAGAVLSGWEDEPTDQLVEGLTPREMEVLELLADGLPNKAIAYQLGISGHTVKFHVNSILGKLAAQSRTEAVVQATRLGLITL